MHILISTFPLYFRSHGKVCIDIFSMVFFCSWSLGASVYFGLVLDALESVEKPRTTRAV